MNANAKMELIQETIVKNVKFIFILFRKIMIILLVN